MKRINYKSLLMKYMEIVWESEDSFCLPYYPKIISKKEHEQLEKISDEVLKKVYPLMSSFRKEPSVDGMKLCDLFNNDGSIKFSVIDYSDKPLSERT